MRRYFGDPGEVFCGMVCALSCTGLYQKILGRSCRNHLKGPCMILYRSLPGDLVEILFRSCLQGPCLKILKGALHYKCFFWDAQRRFLYEGVVKFSIWKDILMILWNSLRCLAIRFQSEALHIELLVFKIWSIGFLPPHCLGSLAVFFAHTICHAAVFDTNLFVIFFIPFHAPFCPRHVWFDQRRRIQPCDRWRSRRARCQAPGVGTAVPTHQRTFSDRGWCHGKRWSKVDQIVIRPEHVNEWRNLKNWSLTCQNHIPNMFVLPRLHGYEWMGKMINHSGKWGLPSLLHGA